MARLSVDQIVPILGNTRLLEGLPREELEMLAKISRQEHVAAGGAIFLKGAPGTCMYLLCEGRVKIASNGPNGNELLLELVDPGYLFGEIAAVDEGPRTVNAIATQASTVLSFDRRYLTPILHRNPASAQAFSEQLCASLRTAIMNLEEIALLDAQTRLWMRLMSLARRYSPPGFENEPIHVEHGLSQQSLADSIGVTRVMVNRQLGIWREAGLIEDGRGYVLIPDPAALEAFVRKRDTDRSGQAAPGSDGSDGA